MSPEEWWRWGLQGHADLGLETEVFHHVPGAELRFQDAGDSECPGHYTRRLHALGAIALIGQPFGFTWDDYDRLDMLAVEADLGHERTDPALVAWYVGMRDRIAALLPPR